MTSRSYFGKMNSTLGSVVPLAMFIFMFGIVACCCINTLERELQSVGIEFLRSYLFVVMTLNVVADRLREVQIHPAHLLQEEIVSDHLETSPYQ